MIVGITGLISSGKDTIAEYLITQHGFKKLSFAASLKDAVAAVFGWDRNLLEGTTQEGRVCPLHQRTYDSSLLCQLRLSSLPPTLV
jgi:hypothetical protein